jgi:anaerobic magnesium-protoporphyrin IX monomethyl ester cyclase
MTRVLLIEPPARGEFGTIRVLGSIGSTKAEIIWPPYDLMILGGLLRKNNIDFKIIDAIGSKVSFSELKKIIKKESPEIVVFTTTPTTIGNDALTAKIAKEVSKKIKTMVVNLSMQGMIGYDKLLDRYRNIDIMAYGEPEIPLLNLINSNYNPKKVLGIFYRQGSRTVKNRPQPPENLDELGIPTHDLVPLKVYRDPLMKRRPMTIVCTSRGCINKCIYCASKFQRPVRSRSIDNVMEEIRLIKGLGIKEIKFFDCTFTNNLAWVEKFLKRMIAEKVNLSWSCDVRADRLPQNIVKLMKRAGCHTVAIGSDSADQKILDNINKNITVKQIEDSVNRVKKEGMRVLMYFTFGHPGETKETIRKSIEFAKKMNPDLVTFGIIVPVYNTEFYNYLKKNNFFLGMSQEECGTNTPPPYSYPDLSSDELYRMIMQGYREFYLRPSFIVKRMLNSTSLRYDFNNLRFFVKRYVIEPRKNA